MPFTNSHDVSKKPRREPVIKSALVTVIVWLAANFGFDLDADVASGIAAAVLALSSMWARSKVTPTADPRLD